MTQRYVIHLPVVAADPAAAWGPLLAEDENRWRAWAAEIDALLPCELFQTMLDYASPLGPSR
ncbi:hypothetical protein AB0F68_06565 [Micromonospora sp. NPDC023966]|uniref:hypothetical protein n=1 Tax=Micromonospora sp. NPDC023966 TaxID=3154699 RepID=UPI00340221C8